MSGNLVKGVAQKSSEWYKMRQNTIGSSEAAYVFKGVAKESARRSRDLLNKLHRPDIKRPPVSEFLQNLFDEGNAAEPLLVNELRDEFNVLVTDQIYRHPTERFSASPDGIGVKDDRLTIIEIKYRAAKAKVADCGWGPFRTEVGIPVWCQVQHQMFLTGIHEAIIYSCHKYAPTVRRKWRVKYSDEYMRTLWIPAARCALKDGCEYASLWGNAVDPIRMYMKRTIVSAEKLILNSITSK